MWAVVPLSKRNLKGFQVFFWKLKFVSERPRESVINRAKNSQKQLADILVWRDGKAELLK